MAYDASTIPTCITCDTRGDTKSCIKCGVVFCKHFASAIDRRCCSNCIGEVKVTETLLEKVIEHQRADGTISFSRKYQAKYMKLEGVDWLFASHLIENMSDAEIEAAVEYHRANVDLMLAERQSRQLERYKKLAAIKIVHRAGESQDAKAKREAKAFDKAAKSVSKSKDPAQMMLDALTVLAKSGMSQQQIMEMLGGKK